MDSLPPAPPPNVVKHFAPHTSGLRWRPAPAGFSGATVFRGDDPSGTPLLALKRWPSGERLARIHHWIARAAHLPFVPGVPSGTGGDRVCLAEGAYWDCSRWMPGAPLAAPSVAETALGCEAVARLHACWTDETERGPCPAVLNRIRVLSETEALLRAGPGALPPVSPVLDPLLRRAVEVAARAAPGARRQLEPWATIPLHLQPCVRDLRGDHVLFVGAAVTGLIDYGAAAIDHPATDLARLLADYAPAQTGAFDAGLAAYRAAGPALAVPDEFVRLLAHTGALCSALNWVRRLAGRGEPVADPAAVAARLEHVLARIAPIR